MEIQSDRWKKLPFQPQPVINSEQTSRSKSKPRKFTPKRTSISSDLCKKIPSLSINVGSTEISQSREKEMIETKNKVETKKSSIYPESKPLFIELKNSEGFDINKKSRLRPSPSFDSDGNELNSPTTLLKHLRQIERTEVTKEMPVKALFSLDEEHRYISNELYDIKIAFSKLKEEVEMELIRQHQYMKNIVNGIISEFKKVLELCGKSESMAEMGEILQGFEMFDINELSEINKKESVNDSKIELKNLIFCEEYLKIDERVGKHKELSSSLTQFAKISPRSHHFKSSRSELKLTKEDSSEKTHAFESQIQRENELEYHKEQSQREQSKSKREFVKLFEAVNCLKRDIKEIKGISSTVKHTNPHMAQSETGFSDKRKEIEKQNGSFIDRS